MSSKNQEDREKRYSLRRHDSSEQLSQSESTDSLKTPRMRQLKTHVDSPIPTTPRRSRRLSQDSFSQENLEVKSSRPTRRNNLNSSSEIQESPARKRFTRASSVTSDEEDSISIASTESSRRVTRSRKSVAVIPTIDLIAEEEEELEKLNESNELNLRNRSISKSPNVSAGSISTKPATPVNVNGSSSDNQLEKPQTRGVSISVVDILKKDKKIVSSLSIRKESDDMFTIEAGQQSEISIKIENTDTMVDEDDKEQQEKTADDVMEVDDKSGIVISTVQEQESNGKLSESSVVPSSQPQQSEILFSDPEADDQVIAQAFETEKIQKFHDSYESLDVSKLAESPVKGNSKNKSFEAEDTAPEIESNTESSKITEELEKSPLKQIERSLESPSKGKKTPQKDSPVNKLQVTPMKKKSTDIQTNQSTTEKQNQTPSKQDHASSNEADNCTNKTPFKSPTPAKRIETPSIKTPLKDSPVKKLQVTPLRKQSNDTPTKQSTAEKQDQTPSKAHSSCEADNSTKMTPLKSPTPAKRIETTSIKTPTKKSVENAPTPSKMSTVSESASQKSPQKNGSKRDEVQDVSIAENTLKSPQKNGSKIQDVTMAEANNESPNISKMDISTVEESDMEITLKGKKDFKMPHFTTTWTQPYIGIAGEGTKIDAYEREKSPEPIHMKSPTKSSKKKVVQEEFSEEEFSEEEEDNNSFIDDEAVEAENYDSGDSLSSGERNCIEENEIVEAGHDLGSDDTTAESGSDEELDNTDDSFIVTDAESCEEEESGKDSEPELKSKSPLRKRIIVDSSEESDEAQEILKSPQKRKSIHEAPEIKEKSSETEIKEKSPEKLPIKTTQKTSPDTKISSAGKLLVKSNKRKLSETTSPEVEKAKRPRIAESDESEEDMGINQLFKTPGPSKKSLSAAEEKSGSESDDDLLNNSKDSVKLNGSMKSPIKNKELDQSKGSSKKSKKIENNDAELDQAVVPENLNKSLKKTPKKSKDLNSVESASKKHMQNSGAEPMEIDSVLSTKKQSKIKADDDQAVVKIDKILEKCNNYINEKENERKKFKTLKKQRLEEKKKLKQTEEDNEGSAKENENNGDSPASGLKKKKKNKSKVKKQKLVADDEIVKDDLADMVKKKQELAEKRKLRKKEKKMAKKLKQLQEVQATNKENLETPVPKNKATAVKDKNGAKSKKDEKLAKVADKNKEKVAVDNSPKQIAASAKLSNKIADSDKKNVLHKIDSNKNKIKKHMEGSTKLTAVDHSNKKKIGLEEVVAGTHKKRKFEELELSDNRVFEFKGAEQSPPKAKKIKSAKRLNVLENIQSYNRFIEQPKTPETKNKWGFQENNKTPPPPLGMKVSKLISKAVLDKKLLKKIKKTKLPDIREPATSLPRPVWTSSGEFLEEPIEKPKPFKFDKDFINLKSHGKTSFAFQSAASPTNKKKKQVPALSFKQSALYRKGIVRDSSKKNLKFLG